jgi:hypothetical protein
LQERDAGRPEHDRTGQLGQDNRHWTTLVGQP